MGGGDPGDRVAVLRLMDERDDQLILWDSAALPASDPFAHLTEETADLLTLRDYQVEATDAAWRMFHVENFQRLLGVAAMGAGKTVMFADLTRREVLRGGKALVLVDQDELVGQAVDRVRETTGILADVEQGERYASRGSRVVVSTVQSMRGRLNVWPAGQFGLVVADEADRSVSEQWSKVLKHFDPYAKVLGVTATPNRADRKDLMGYFQAKAFDIPLTYLVERGFLTRIRVRTVPLKIDVRTVKQNKGDYDKAQLAAALRPYFDQICEALKTYAPDRKTLIFHPLTHTSREFVDVARAHQIDARHIDGDSPDRREIQQAFRERQFSTLSNALLLSRGYDDPSIDCVVNLRLTRHRTMYEQIVGRGTRLWCPERCPEACEHEGRKRDLLLLDFLWQFEKFDIMRPAGLLAKDAKREKKMSDKFAKAGCDLDLIEVEVEASLEHEKDLLAEFEKSAKRKSKGNYFDALQWAATMSIPNLIDWEPETEEDLEDMTQGQRTRLEKAGFVVATVRGRSHAAKIIEVLDARIRAGRATFKQVHWLRKFGVEGAMEMSMEDATRELDKHFGKGPSSTGSGRKWWYRKRKKKAATVS